MSKPKKKDKQVAIRLEASDADRAERLLKSTEFKKLYGAFMPKRAAVLRAALLKGLAIMEKELL